MLENPVIWNKLTIVHGDKEIAYIQLVDYIENFTPHLEVYLKPKHRGKGVMSKFLPEYLEGCKKNEKSTKLVAVCKEKNIAGQKLVEKFGFVKTLMHPKGKITYLRDLKHSVEDLQAFMRGFARPTKAC
jgi:RimJ/RimL family protein N-acetyltransferase